MPDEINMQSGKFMKNIKRAGQNRRAGGNFFRKSIKVRAKIRLCRENFFFKNTPNGKNKKNSKAHPKYSKGLPKALLKHYQSTPKQGRIARKEVCLIHTGPQYQ